MIVVGAMALAGALVLSGCGSTSRATPPTPQVSALLPCAAQPEGALCIKVFRVRHAVADVVAYLAASESPFAGRTWRLVMSQYPCDPGSQPLPGCRPVATYPGPTRHGRPPLGTSCREKGSTKVVTAPSGCHDTLAQEIASFGAFAGFNPPHTFTSRVWLCVSEQVRAGGSWRQPTRPLAPTPTRACAAVSPT